MSSLLLVRMSTGGSLTSVIAFLMHCEAQLKSDCSDPGALSRFNFDSVVASSSSSLLLCAALKSALSWLMGSISLTILMLPSMFATFCFKSVFRVES